MISLSFMRDTCDVSASCCANIAAMSKNCLAPRAAAARRRVVYARWPFGSSLLIGLRRRRTRRVERFGFSPFARMMTFSYVLLPTVTILLNFPALFTVATSCMLVGSETGATVTVTAMFGV